MNKYLLVVSLFYIATTFGQCPEGNVVLTSQSEVDNFGDIYPNCETIEGFLIISGNDIVNLSALSQINSVGSIQIDDTSLTDVQGLEALTITGLGGQDAFIVFDNNQMLQDILYLNNYTVNVPIVFLIRDMSLLSSLEGASNISEFVTIYLENNDALTDLEGLNENLNLIGGLVQSPFLYISENATLSDVSQLNTAQGNNALTCEITNNSQLAVCENTLVCTLIEVGSSTILNNALGCNSNSEVSMACENLSLNTIEDNLLRIYPNPVSRDLFIDGLDIENLEYLRIYSTKGHKMLETNKLELDMSAFQTGIYFLEITTNKGVLTKLVVKE